MLSFVIDRVRGPWVAALSLASMFYGWIIIVALPFWDRLQAVQGGRELQTRFFYDAEEAGVALTAINTAARQDALIFYALDAPNAVLYGLALAAWAAFGLRRLNWERTPARGLVLLGLIAGVADLLENLCLTVALLNNPAEPGAWGAAAGALTAAKFTAGVPGQVIGLLLLLVGLIVWAWRKIRSSAQPSPS
jgi:hypothetical protein